MKLTLFDLLNGLFSLSFVAIATIIGLIIVSKYFIHKQKTFLYIGFAFPGLAGPWWPSSISFLMIIFTGTSLSLQTYLILGNVFLPIFITLWLLGVFELVKKEFQKAIALIYMIIGIIFEIIFFYFLIINPNILGKLDGPIDIEYHGFSMVFLMLLVLTIDISGTILIIEIFKSENAEIRLKGKFLLIALISFNIGAIADGFFPLTVITLPIFRIILISCIFEFYIGWILPKRVKKFFLKS